MNLYNLILKLGKHPQHHVVVAESSYFKVPPTLFSSSSSCQPQAHRDLCSQNFFNKIKPMAINRHHFFFKLVVPSYKTTKYWEQVSRTPFMQREVYEIRRAGATLFFCTAKYIPALCRSMHWSVNCISSTNTWNKPPPLSTCWRNWFQTTALDLIVVWWKTMPALRI